MWTKSICQSHDEINTEQSGRSLPQSQSPDWLEELGPHLCGQIQCIEAFGNLMEQALLGLVNSIVYNRKSHFDNEILVSVFVMPQGESFPVEWAMRPPSEDINIASTSLNCVYSWGNVTGKDVVNGETHPLWSLASLSMGGLEQLHSKWVLPLSFNIFDWRVTLSEVSNSPGYGDNSIRGWRPMHQLFTELIQCFLKALALSLTSSISLTDSWKALSHLVKQFASNCRKWWMYLINGVREIERNCLLSPDQYAELSPQPLWLLHQNGTNGTFEVHDSILL